MKYNENFEEKDIEDIVEKVEYLYDVVYHMKKDFKKKDFQYLDYYLEEVLYKTKQLEKYKYV